MKGKMTVSHAKFQYYRHNYCLTCMTGLLGCRWHRYQQSTRENRKRDMFWFTLCILTFLYITFFFYFWLIAENDYNHLEWYMFDLLKKWVPWYRIMLPLTCATFGFFLLIMILYLCHIGHGHQIFIHMVHVVLTILTLAACVAVTVMLNSLWNFEFHVLYLSLQMMGPFLHVGAVVIMTSLTWFISHSWYKLSRKLYQLGWLVVLLGAMVGLYIAPLYIQCPCITSVPSMPPRPKLFAHRGAEGIAPENTMIAFQKAVEYGAFGLESDVRISRDGVPFIVHDDTFRRTTNVVDLYPDRADEDVSLFTWAEIQRLDAGSWFLDQDPFNTAGSVSGVDQEVYRNQTVPTLMQLMNISAITNTVVMFDVRDPVEGSVYHGKAKEIVAQYLVNSAMNLSRLYWLTEEDSVGVYPPGVVLVSPRPSTLAQLQGNNISKINVRYDFVDADLIRQYHNNSIDTNIYVVDLAWFYSYYWCLGTHSVTTRRIDMLAGVTSPVWTLTDSSYLIMWVAVDVVSVVIILVIFVVQRIRLFGTSFSPESVSLTSARRARTYRSRNMKEKLLRDGIIDPVEDGEGQGAGVVNHPAAYSMSSLPASSSFSSPPPTVHTGIHSHPDHKYQVE